MVHHKLRCVSHHKFGRFFLLHKPFRFFIFPSQTLQIFCLALCKKAQYVVVMQLECNGALDIYDDALVLVVAYLQACEVWINTQGKGTMLCIGPNNSIGKVIPFYGCGQMDKWRLYIVHYNVKALWGMLMRSWAILGSDGHIVWCKHNSSDKGCNCKFENLFLGVWCVTEFKHLSMHWHFTSNPCQLWGLGINGV